MPGERILGAHLLGHNGEEIVNLFALAIRKKLTVSDLKEIPKGSKVDNRSMIFGIAAHDIYHAGQIQLIKRMVR